MSFFLSLLSPCGQCPVLNNPAGIAKRRRERRLRQFLRHERLTIAMLLTETNHHADPRGQTMARSGRWVRGALHSEVPEAPAPQEPGTQHFFLDDDSVPELGGSRPDRLADVRPQERVPRRIVEQIVDSAPVLPLLHAPVPQTVGSLGEVLKVLDKLAPDVEQVIDVPMIFPEDFWMRTFRSSLLEPQTAEQLVELPVFDHVGFRRYEGALGLGVCRVPGHVFFVRVHDTGWRDTANWAQVTSLRPCPTRSSSLRRTVDGASLQFIDRAGYCRYATETCTHSVKLCFFGCCACQGRSRHCRVAEAVSLRPVQQTTEIHQLQSTLVQVQQILGCRPREIGRDPTVALVVFVPGKGRSHARCVQRQMPRWFRRQKTAQVPQLQYV